MINKLVMGTAQFGMDYGINNARGLIPENEARRIFDKAMDAGVDTFDTAPSYGTSETILGKYSKRCQRKLKIISKIPGCVVQEAEGVFAASLERLNVARLYGYLIHDFPFYKKNKQIWGFLERIKKEGKAEKIGFSLYFPHELEYILERKLKIDIVQVPFSVFDQRFSPYFSVLKKKGVEINVRSVFLQGLAFMKPEALKGRLIKIKSKLLKLNALAEKNNLHIAALCLNFAFLSDMIDKVVVGVDSLNNFKEIVVSLNYGLKVKGLISELSEFREEDEGIILPFNWKKGRRNVT